MVTHMKTTVDITDTVLNEAKETARREGSTLRGLIEEGLRLALERRVKPGRFRLEDAAVGGCGLQPGVRGADWSEILDRSYEGRGS